MSPSQTVRADEFARERKAPGAPVDPEEPGGAALAAAAEQDGVAGVTGAAALAGEVVSTDEVRDKLAGDAGESMQPAPRRRRTATDPAVPPAGE